MKLKQSIKVDNLSLSIALLIGVFILIYPPFIASVYVPAFIRIPLLFILVAFFFFLAITKRSYVYQFGPWVCFFLIQEVYWLLTGNKIVGDTIYFLLFALLASSIVIVAKRIPQLKFLVRRFYLILIVSLSILAILSFLAFNLDIFPYVLKTVGQEEYYEYYHNIFFGYVNLKIFETFNIGRVCGYLFEPSYLGWFLTTNFFILDRYLITRKYLIPVRIIVLLGALASFSTASWIVFAIVGLLNFFYIFLSLIKIKGRLANMIILISFLLVGGITILAIPKQKLIEGLGTSSHENREDRVMNSLLILANSSIPDIILGRSPGFIEVTVQTGESNQLMKILVEYGIITFSLIIAFIVYCTKKSRLFLVANLLFLNSVVIFFTPLFIFNLIVCKWNDEEKTKKIDA
ncbi:hypothetical protein [Pedobacter heparinus]|uniref:O-antigen polymerase n=1 Tax=Pedobacter heparinus (strain ATCC 13125 / DSM 2366 / CIP 104194 / JCM 7457 / NBRC 12017 / NCIMB 9290 / NRRL B-14731 / HIM 762-3) TaxID=485917 RepID=C6XVP4_PEDHD|nr:hypothetical protein [Pedobacter heparinus]ACU06119.1 hypothetical protein Phep_3928 [Pedobacter heparinus DSM 2366]